MCNRSSPVTDSPEMRRAGPDVLSRALDEARQHTLQLMGHYEAALQACGFTVPPLAELNPPLWELGHIGWFQEWWLRRNPQRLRGRAADPDTARLASLRPQADLWWHSGQVAHDRRWELDFPDLDDIKRYLRETLASTQDLLATAPDEDDALYFFRLALFHEDMHGEALTYMAQTLGLPLALHMPGPQLVRAPVQIPATRWTLGLDNDGRGSPGFTFDNECPAHEVAVPAFEIDAQLVTWAQFLAFVQDGGYDRQSLWQPEGWHSLQDQAARHGRRRAPRHVDPLSLACGVVRQTCFGTPQCMLASQPVMHLNWWEADAWCRWAGRRLPTEVEWEVSAMGPAADELHWGDLWEWTASPFGAYPGFKADPYRDYSEPWFGTHQVLRGASFATRARLRHLKFRNFYRPERNDIFVGFRSCAR